jgi:hypothetical protein
MFGFEDFGGFGGGHSHGQPTNDATIERAATGNEKGIQMQPLRVMAHAGARVFDRLRVPVQLRFAAMRTETSPLPARAELDAVQSSAPIVCIT